MMHRGRLYYFMSVPGPKGVSKVGLEGLDPSWLFRRQTLQSGGWEVAGGIFLLDFLFKALARVVLGRGPSYFTISSLQLDLRSWKLE
ncbi:hypothetical protein Tco_0540382 [Tanacetum coccineum]